MAPSLLAAGLLWGLAVQTHPSALALLPGAAIFLLTQGRPLLRTRWPYLAAALFLMINLNLVIYNLTNGFDSVATGLRHSRQLTQEEHLTPQVYLGRLRELGIGLLLDLGGDVALHESDDAFLDPGLLLIALVAGAGVVWQWRRGNRLPGLLLASMALLLPLFNGSYQPIWFRGRYLMPLLPLLFAGGGSLGAAALERLGNLGRDRSPALARLGLLGLGLATAYLLLHPLLYLRTYYDQVIGNSRDNTQFFHTLAQLKAHRQSEETIILSQDFADTWRPGVGGRLAFAFRLALAVENLPYRILDPTSSELLDRNSRCRDRFVILAFHRHEVDESVLTGLDLRRLDHSRVDLRAEQASHGPFRLDRLPGAPPTC